MSMGLLIGRGAYWNRGTFLKKWHSMGSAYWKRREDVKLNHYGKNIFDNFQ